MRYVFFLLGVVVPGLGTGKQAEIAELQIHIAHGLGH